VHINKTDNFIFTNKHCVQTDPAKDVWTRAYLIPERNWTGRRHEEGKNSVYNSKRNWAKFGVGVKLIVILQHIIAYFSINIRWHSQNVSSDSRKWIIKHLSPPSSCKKQINKQNSYLLRACCFQWHFNVEATSYVVFSGISKLKWRCAPVGYY
jgi:hypothetical protein